MGRKVDMGSAQQEQIERLLAFRSEHPTKKIDVLGVRWEYIACGNGKETLLLLPGGLRVAETAFAYVQLFENAYRVIVPTYPPVWTMSKITEGITAILDAEHIEKVLVLGQSYGGQVAQVFVRCYPARVKKLILSSTGPVAALSRRQRVLAGLSRVMPLFPERLLLSVYKRALLSVMSFPESDRVFWEAYLDEVFKRHLTKADVLSHFRTSKDAVTRYGYAEGEQSDWGGNVLIIGADDDRVSSEGDRRRMRGIYPQAQVYVFAGGGHTVAMSKPEEYAAAVTTFLKQ